MPQLQLPVGAGGRGRPVEPGGHHRRDRRDLHPGRRRPGQDPQGAGELRRRRRQYRDADQRGDGDGDHRGRCPSFADKLVRNGRGRAGRAGVAARAGGRDNSFLLRIPLFGGGHDFAGRDVATSPDRPRYAKSGVLPGGEGSDERHDPYLPGSCGKRSRRKRAGDRDRGTNITAVLHHRRVRRPAPALAGPTDSRGTRNLYQWKYRYRVWGWRGKSWNPDTCCVHLPFNQLYRLPADIRRFSQRCHTRARH